MKWPTIYIAVFCAGLTTSTAILGAKVASPDAEFSRALSIIEKTQLELFTDTLPGSPAQIELKLDTLSAAMEGTLDTEDDAFEQIFSNKRIEIMRSLLSDTLDTYNDQYANYISPEQLKKYSEQRSGSYEGVGLKFRAISNDYPLVIGPIIGGPLHDKNLLPGDKILEANKQSLKGLSSSQIVSVLKGPAESDVHLKIGRKDTTHHVHGKRGPVDLHYARSEIINNNLGYIRISRFGGKTHQRVLTLLKDLVDHRIEGLVLDLRKNPGGSTRAARAIVSMFSKEKYVYCEKHKSGAINKLPRHGAHVTDMPLAILVNGDSMSSSEIVAGALQSYGRGIIIGSPTFGKGLVQRVFNLKQPLGGAIRTTIAVFGRPDLEVIHGAGIVPDIYVETPADFMFTRTGSLNIKDDARAYQRLLLENDVRKKHPHKAQALIDATDRQLNIAIQEIIKALKKKTVSVTEDHHSTGKD